MCGRVSLALLLEVDSDVLELELGLSEGLGSWSAAGGFAGWAAVSPAGGAVCDGTGPGAVRGVAGGLPVLGGRAGLGCLQRFAITAVCAAKRSPR